jgi:hypothetical protein
MKLSVCAALAVSIICFSPITSLAQDTASTADGTKKVDDAKSAPSPGLLKKTNDTESWKFEVAEDGKGEMKVEGDAIVFETTETGFENWHVQAYQADVALTDGKTYEVKFTAKSPTSSTVLLMGIINEEDWHSVGLHEEVWIGEKYKEHSFSFTATDVVKNNRIGFVLGESKGTVYVKNMSVVEK